MRVDLRCDIGVGVTQNALRSFWVYLFFGDYDRRQRVAECVKSSPTPVRCFDDDVLNELWPNVSVIADFQVNILQFLDLRNCNRASTFSLECGAGRLHILSHEGHHPFPLPGIGHVRGDWEINVAILGEDDDR